MREKFLSFWHNFIQAPLLICLLVTAVPFCLYMTRMQELPEMKPDRESGEDTNSAWESIPETGIIPETDMQSEEERAAEAGRETTDEASTEPAAIDPALQVIPDGVNNPVMQAVDYGNVNTAYRAPSGTVFEHDRSGIFAPDGTYYYLQSVPDDSYFADALFIGDSRMAGFSDYSSLRTIGSFWAKESMSVYNIYDDKITLLAQGSADPDGAKTLDDVLENRQYGKIYITMGINEMGMPYTTTYVDRYREILTDIRERQPDAIIFITGIMHVSRAVSSSDPVNNNPNIVERNEAVVSLTNGRDIFYLDMNPAVCDDNGDLIDELTGDGVHLKASAYEKWADFLRQNAIVKN